MDHDRVNISTSAMSCGVRELSRINEDTEGVLYALGTNLYHPGRGEPCAFYVWSDIAGEYTASNRLKDDVELNKLGFVEVSTITDNPRTGNPIMIFIWNIDHEIFKRWYAEKRVARYAKVGR
jgi:hypothetical protein